MMEEKPEPLRGYAEYVEEAAHHYEAEVAQGGKGSLSLSQSCYYSGYISTDFVETSGRFILKA